MLVVSANADAALQAHARPAFAVRVRRALADTYPETMACFPEPLQNQLVSNMLGRASLWGLSQQTSLLAFCEFMLGIAPNFDEEPEIRSALDKGPKPLDNTIVTLPDTVSERAWDRAGFRRSNLALFVGPNMLSAPVRDQTVAAVPLALFGRPEVGAAASAVQQAEPQALAMGFQDYPDSLLLVAGLRSFYGPEFMRERWVEDLRRQNLSPADMQAALRARLMAEFGRFL